MPVARKLWLVSLMTIACGQTASQVRSATPAPQPNPSVKQEHQERQPILVTRNDLASVDSRRFLYVFPIESSTEVAHAILRNDEPLIASDTAGWCLRLNLRRLDSADRRDLLRRLGVKDRYKDYVKVPWRYTPAQDKPTPQQLASSFVIDYDDPRFTSFWSKVQRNRRESSGTTALVDAVAKHIEVKTTTRMFDTAAEVAHSRQGDCTEHAALLTALLRRSGKPARLVTGLAVLVEGQQLGAFGHAWTETYENGSWQVVDAALHPVPGRDHQRVRAIRYIPVTRMVDEGAGFAAAMAKVRSIEAISSLLVEACGAKVRPKPVAQASD